MIRNTFINISLCLWIGFIGCMGIHEQPKSAEPLAETNVDKIKTLIEQRQPEKALEILQQALQNGDTFYMMGCVYGSVGDTETSISFYQKALTAQSDHHAAYIALTNTYQTQLLGVQAQMDILEQKKECALEEGNVDIKKIFSELEQIQRRRSQLYISQAKSYILYSETASNIADFAVIEAHLRDVQDTFQEKQMPSDDAEKRDIDTTSDPLLLEIQQIRCEVTKKYAKTLFNMGVEQAVHGNISKAVDALKEADDHVSKFFLDEKPSRKEAYLGIDNDVISLANDILSHLARYYQTFLDMTLENKVQFIEMGNREEEENQTHRIEEILQSWIQLEINALWKFDKIERQMAEEHEKLVPLYKKFLQHLPNSTKTGDYHFRLAHFYQTHGNIAEAKLHAQKAQEKIGGYEIEKFLEQLETIK